MRNDNLEVGEHKSTFLQRIRFKGTNHASVKNLLSDDPTCLSS